jgi:hypothetical protein
MRRTSTDFDQPLGGVAVEFLELPKTISGKIRDLPGQGSLLGRLGQRGSGGVDGRDQGKRVAEIEGREVHGVDLVRWDATGRVIEFTVMVRPLRWLEALVDLIFDGFTGSLPSGRSTDGGEAPRQAQLSAA